jgi:predicted GNAT family N-acyltransferase
MKLEFVEYNSIYLKSCAKLVSETWKLDDELVNASQARHLYYYYIRHCASSSIYTDLLVDQETGRVFGILFASDENHLTSKSSIKKFKNLSILFKHIILGHLGKRSIALKCIRDMLAIDKSVEKYCENFDSELNLFILSKEFQGQGYGRILMNRFIQFCKNEQQIKNIFLWTDISCNRGFYQHYGFRLYRQFYDHRLTDHCDKRTDKPNGFIYYKILT